MAFTADTLVKVAGAEPALWMYNSATDAGPAMVASGYFDTVTDNLKNGDVIIIVDADTQVGLATVSSATGAATVTVIGTALALV